MSDPHCWHGADDIPLDPHPRMEANLERDLATANARIAALEAERDRLRAALIEIEKGETWLPNGTPLDKAHHCYIAGRLKARAALAGEKPSKIYEDVPPEEKP